MAARVIKTDSTMPEAPAQPGIGRQFSAFIEAVLLAIWLGAMVFFSFAVAPSAFAVLPTRQLAGTLVTSTIAKVEVLGLVIGAALILLQIATWRANRAGFVAKLVRLVLTAAMVAAAALSHFRVSPAMVSLRTSMGDMIDDVPLTDPLRIHFNDLHQYSVGLMSVALLAGFVVLFLSVRSWMQACVKR